MRIRMLAMLVIASLAISPLRAAGADPKLSSGFLKPAGDYLQTVRDCSNRVLADINASCDFQALSDKARDAVTTAGDKLVADNLDKWVGFLVLYSITAIEVAGDAQKQAQRQNGIKHISDVCSAELGKALEYKNAPEKSLCSDALTTM